MEFLISSREMRFVPLKFMCSTQCDAPVRPGPSSFDPTRYQHQTETSGAVRTSCTTTRRPLASVSDRSSAPAEPRTGPSGRATAAASSIGVIICLQVEGAPGGARLVAGAAAALGGVPPDTMPDWKDTLNLPRTGFRMKASLPATEPQAIARWEEADLYGQIRRRARAPRSSCCTTDRRTPTAASTSGPRSTRS